MERWKAVGLREDQLLARLTAANGDASALARELGTRSAAMAGGAQAARLAELRAELAQRSPAYAQARRSAEVSAADIAAALRPGELLLDYWVVPASARSAKDSDTIIGALVAPDGVRAVRRLGTVGPLAKVSGIAAIFTDDHNAALADTVFVEPFAAEIAGAERLFISPDGPLHLVPFEALRSPRGHYLVEELELEMVRGGASLVAARKSDGSAQQGAVIADAIDYGSGPKRETPIRPLKGDEGAAIAEILRGSPFAPVTLVSGRAASKQWLMNLSAPRILHLSTHGTYRPSASAADNPLALGAIALAGANEDYGSGNRGILTAAEAMNLKLDGADLVVLSACDTARGGATYAEGLAGLPSALAVAGARRTLLALWPVSEAGATAFMRRFYRHLVRAPDDYAGALRATKLDAIAGRLGGKDRAPDWKAFVLIRN
jgi:hypothetical protein